MDKIEELKAFYSKKRWQRRKRAQEIVMETLRSPGWKIILEDYKRSLREEYSGFLKIPFFQPLAFWRKRTYCKLLKDIIERAYILGGMRWKWNGYEEIEDQYDVRDAQQLEEHERMLNYITGEDLLGEDNG